MYLSFIIMHHTAAEHMRLLIPYIGRKALYTDYEGDEREMILDFKSIFEMGDYQLQPYLKPMSASIYGSMVKALHFAWEQTKHIPYDEIQVCHKWSITLDILRWEGFDCDRLVEQGLALLDPAYDIKDLL